MKRAIFIFLLIGWQYCRAQQFGCIDSLAIGPSFLCPTEYKPVCGCNNETYRNECEAKQKYGVQTYTEGSCSGFEIDIIPTFHYANIDFAIVQAIPNFARLSVVDMYGKLWWEKDLSAVPKDAFQIDISPLPIGSYILYVYDTNGTYRYKRFMRIPF